MRQISSLQKGLIFNPDLSEWGQGRDLVSGVIPANTAVYPVLDKSGSGQRWLDCNGTNPYISLPTMPTVGLGDFTVICIFYLKSITTFGLFGCTTANGMECSIVNGYIAFRLRGGANLSYTNNQAVIGRNVFTYTRNGTVGTYILNGITTVVTDNLSYAYPVTRLNYSNQGYGTAIFYIFRMFNYALTSQQVINYSKPEYPIEWVDRIVGTVGAVLTSGTITVGKKYLVKLFVAGDSFTNVGGTNTTGTVFTATGTTPTTWSNSSQLIQLGCILDLNAEGMASATWVDKTNSLTATNSGTTFVLPSASNLKAMFYNGAAKLAYTGMDAATTDITFATEITPLTLAGRIFDNSKLLVYVNPSGYLTVSRDGTTLINSAASSIAINTTYKVAVTSTSAGVTNIYINGVLSGTANQAAGTPASGTTWNLGNNAASNQAFTGRMKTPIVENRIMTLDEISLLNSIL